MKAVINHDQCIGDGICADTCPEVFEMRDDGLAYVIMEGDIPENLQPSVKEATDACPTSAIELS